MSAQFESLKLAGHTIQDTFLPHNPYPRGQWIAVVHSSNALFGESQQRVHIQVKVSKFVRSSVSECVVRHDLGWTEVWSEGLRRCFSIDLLKSNTLLRTFLWTDGPYNFCLMYVMFYWPTVLNTWINCGWSCDIQLSRKNLRPTYQHILVAFHWVEGIRISVHSSQRGEHIHHIFKICKFITVRHSYV